MHSDYDHKDVSNTDVDIFLTLFFYQSWRYEILKRLIPKLLFSLTQEEDPVNVSRLLPKICAIFFSLIFVDRVQFCF